jgi:hypothetical protein
MEMKKVGVVLLILLGVAVITSVMALPVNALSQMWRLDSEAHTAGHVQMEKIGGPGDDGQTGQVTIPGTGYVTWFADEAAAVDVAIPTDAFWVTQIKTDMTYTDNPTASVGYSTGGGDFTPIATVRANLMQVGDNFLEIRVQSENAVVPNSNYLALKIFGPAGKTIYTDGSSYLTSPSTDPGYPVPELPAFALLGTGLLLLGGYVALKKRSRVVTR